MQAGNQPGPADEIYLSWPRAVERPISVRSLYRARSDVEREQIAISLDVGQGRTDCAGGCGPAGGSRGSATRPNRRVAFGQGGAGPSECAGSRRCSCKCQAGSECRSVLGASGDHLIEAVAVALNDRRYEIARVSNAWTLRTCPAYAPTIRAAADPGEQKLDCSRSTSRFLRPSPITS